MIKLTLCFLAVLSPQVFAFPKEMTVKVALSITVDGEPAGDIKIGLFGNTVPKTVDNFVQICEGAEDLVDTRG